MSAIAGVFSRKMRGEPTEAPVHEMLQSMENRFSDGRSVVTVSPVTLGLGWFNSTGEREGGPFCSQDHSLFIVGDVRLDNRQTLIQILGSPVSRITDSELILRAYRKWGDNAPSHLEGDFAFAIWDSTRQKLYCARDRFGIKPFYFYLTETRFAFASDMSALLEMPDARPDIDEDRIADFLVGLPNETGKTAFRAIRRLPPREFMSITPDDFQTANYWVVPPGQPIKNSERPEVFADLFIRSVKNRMRGTRKLGVMLSGGLDSSSIACVARDLRLMQGPGDGQRREALDAYSLVFEKGSRVDESRYIQAVLNTGGFNARFLGPEMPEPFDQYETVLREQSELFLAPGLANTRSIYAQAKADGNRVLLDGHGGDEVVSHGYGRLRELAVQNRWARVWLEACGASKILNLSPVTIFVQLLTSRFATSTTLPKPIRALSQSVLPHHIKVRFARNRTSWRQLVNEDLVHRTNLVARFSGARGTQTGDASEQNDHLRSIANPLIPHAFEVLDRAAGANGIEPRYPFWDKDLLLFCLSLPASEKLNGGWTRLILRKAMQGILPPTIQWRRDKTDFTSNIAASMLSHNQILMRNIMDTEAERIAPYVDMDFLRNAIQRLSKQGERANLDDILHVWRSVWLSLWLQQMERGRVR